MKALIAMSGGVDSAVAALLARKQGYECIGCTMKLCENKDAAMPSGGACGSPDGSDDARSVAERLGMPYHVFDLRDEFEEKVIDRFVSSYLNGRTPNPCISCNRYLKFGKLYERAQQLGCGRVVTGHYARIEESGGRYVLKKGLDANKDQSYVLFFMDQFQLAHTFFPLGGISKDETRRIAKENGFVNADRPDSQDICFVPGGDYARVIEERSGHICLPGDYLDLSGRVIGRHRGTARYTVGQHRKLGQSFAGPMYVCRIDAERNTVTLGREEDLYSRYVTVRDMHWISGEPPEGALPGQEGYRCRAKLRYRHPERSCVAFTEPGERLRLVFDEPQRAPAPGQFAVLYDGDICLGGGEIV